MGRKAGAQNEDENEEKKLSISLRKTVQNISYAVAAQIISMCLGIVLSLFVPKILGVESFAYWQLFLLYIGYVGLSHLGLNDGMYLRLGGKAYQELNYSLLGSQFRLLAVEQILISIIFSVLVLGLHGSSVERIFVLLGTICYMILDNLTNYLCYVFQATNQIKKSAAATMVFNIFALILVVIMLLVGTAGFQYIIAFYVAARLFSFCYAVYYGREIVFAARSPLGFVLREYRINIGVGVKLLCANLLSTFLWGVGRYVTDARWGIEEFGRFAYAISLMNFYTALIYQIGMVLFPALRQSKENQQKDFFRIVSDFFCAVIPAAYLAYYPLKYLLHIWLPQYDVSIQYLALLLPLCLLDGMVQILTNTYLKVLRKEKDLLWLNIMATVLCTVLSLIGAFVLDSILSIVLSIVIAVVLRSVLAQVRVSGLLGVQCAGRIIGELVLAGIFGVSAWMIEGIGSWVLIAAAYIIYLFCYKKKLSAAVKGLKSMR